jgi:hypothetical protein
MIIRRFVGSGQAENWPYYQMEILTPMDLNCVEKSVKERLEKHYNKILTIGRTANSVPHNGRGSCQYRNLCSRGCPFGAYFSTIFNSTGSNGY